MTIHILTRFLPELYVLELLTYNEEQELAFLSVRAEIWRFLHTNSSTHNLICGMKIREIF